MAESWDRRINRTRELAFREDDAAWPLVAFYGTLLRLQKELYDFVRGRPGWRPTGALDRDLAMLRPQVPALLRGVAAAGSSKTSQNPTLAREASLLLEGPASAIDELLLNYWHTPSDRQFFPKAILQPHSGSEASRLPRPATRRELVPARAPKLAILT